MNPIDKIGQTAQGLSKNPLGIISLFIVLVYAMASLVLGTTASELMPYERVPIIMFLIFFPIIVLLIFYNLVKKHHWKLYGPGDFESDQSFLEPLSVNDQKEKFIEEVAEALNLAFVDATKMQGTNSIEINDAGSKVWIAESLAMREIANEYKHDISREVELRSDNKRVRLDGASLKDRNLIGIEVKFDKLGIFKSESIDQFMQEFSEVAKSLQSNNRLDEYRFRLVVVTENDTLSYDALSEDLKKLANKHEVPIELSLFNYNELEEKYGIKKNKDSQPLNADSL